MPWIIVSIFLWAFLGAAPTRAIEMNGGYNTNAPTAAGIPNWNTGWASSSVSGWDYVGQISVASGVYVGNGWVLTATHVGVGPFTLTTGPAAGVYQPTGISFTFSNNDGTADLTLFRVTPYPNLPPLAISRTLPVAFSETQTGSTVAMLGYGGSKGKLSWGSDVVTEIDQLVTPQGFTYVSNDFFTDNGTVTRGSTITNNSSIVTGDSGGGDFTYNTTTQRWELTGINEVTGSYDGYDPVADDDYYGNGTFSGMVQLDTYADQINPYIYPLPPENTPTLPVPALVLMAGLLVLTAVGSLRTGSRRTPGGGCL